MVIPLAISVVSMDTLKAWGFYCVSTLNLLSRTRTTYLRSMWLSTKKSARHSQTTLTAWRKSSHPSRTLQQIPCLVEEAITSQTSVRRSSWKKLLQRLSLKATSRILRRRIPNTWVKFRHHCKKVSLLPAKVKNKMVRKLKKEPTSKRPQKNLWTNKCRSTTHWLKKRTVPRKKKGQTNQELKTKTTTTIMQILKHPQRLQTSTK